MVPGGGIEPPTRGFSIRCSTPELPGLATGEARYLTKAAQLVHAVFSHLLTSSRWGYRGAYRRISQLARQELNTPHLAIC